MTKVLSHDLEKERLLSHFTVENLQEAVLWISSSGNIVQVNDMACKMSGFTRQELTEMSLSS
jgi:PAS domain S-box